MIDKARATKELLKDAEKVAEDGYIGGGYIAKLLAELSAKLREREELTEKLHKLCLEKINDYELFEEYYLYKSTPPKKE